MHSKSLYRFFSQNSLRQVSKVMDICPEVEHAIQKGKPLVALESTIITHGMPYPTNLKTALSVESIIRDEGAVPATIAILGGRIKIGLSKAQIEELAHPDTIKVKTSRRDFPYVLSNKMNGGTTVSGTLVAANLAGIRIFVTGGIGGVHRKGEVTFDISADLMELGRTPMMVVSSGVKSILDIGKTLEYLETQGVCVATFGPSKEFPAFYSRISGYKAQYNVASALEAARLLHSAQGMKLDSGILLAVPIPEAFSIAAEEMEKVIQEALKEAEGVVSGKEVTPLILEKVSHLTAGKSLESNVALIENNARVGAKIAVEYQNLFKPRQEFAGGLINVRAEDSKPIVVGGSILDCNVTLEEELKLDGRTVRGRIEESAGGVGRNLADALGKLLPTDSISPPLFVSALGADQAGRFLLDSVGHLDVSGVSLSEEKRTACCSVLLDKKGDCQLVVGDMDIHASISCDQVAHFKNTLELSPMIVFDGNIPVETMEWILEYCVRSGTPVWFEPTDISKTMRPFRTELWKALSFISPNINELREISRGLGFSSECEEEAGAKDLDGLLNEIPALAAPLARYIPTVMVTMGSLGVMMVSQMSHEDTVRNSLFNKGELVHARYYPAVKVESIVSVSGAGDCTAAGFMSGVLQGLTEPECVKIGFSAAVDSLRSKSAIPKQFSTHPSALERVDFKQIM